MSLQYIDETEKENNNRISNAGDLLHMPENSKHKKFMHHRKEKWYIILLVSIVLSIIVSAILIGLTLLVSRKKNVTKVQTEKQLCNVTDVRTLEAQCCNMIKQKTQHLLNVLIIARLTLEKENYVEPYNSNTNVDDSLIHQEAFVDTRYVHDLKHKECLPWLVKSDTNTSDIRYSSRRKRFVIQEKGIYYIYLSITFRFKNTTEISNTVYRNNDRELLSMRKTFETIGDGNAWSYYDTKMSGLFHLYTGDELYMQTSNAGSILPYVVCNYFSIFSIPASVVANNTA